MPLVADMSSHILSRPLDVSKFGLIYAGAQKNIGPAGLTIVIVREDLIGQARAGRRPTCSTTRSRPKNDSMFNTPPTFSLYLAGLIFKWLNERGGLAAMEKINIAKAKLLYDYLDSQDFYANPVAKEDRSRMNIPFTLRDDEARRGLPRGGRGARAVAAEGPPLGGRHARVDLQRDADRGRRGAGRVHGRVRADASGCAVAFRIARLQRDLRRAGSSASPRRATRSARRSPSPTRSWCARTTLAIATSRPAVKAIGARGRRHEQHPGATRRASAACRCSTRPGANANAVKELVLAAMLTAARNLVPARRLRRSACRRDDDFDKRVEDGKKQFAGFELPGRTLGVIGLGTIGSLVADAAIKLGMNVLGYDPEITVDAAWSLPSQVRKAHSIEEVLKGSRLRHAARAAGERTRNLIDAQAPRRS